MEATTTLADALLDDLDDLSDHEYAVDLDDEEEEDHHHHHHWDGDNDDNDRDNIHPGDNDETMMMDILPDDRKKRSLKYNNICEQPDFMNHIRTIQPHYRTVVSTTTTSTTTTTTTNNTITKTAADVLEGSNSLFMDDSFMKDSVATETPVMMRTPAIQQLPQDHSKLLTRTNQYLMMIEQELEIYHSKVLDIYQHKFPQLDTIITNIQQYIQVVQILDNHTDITRKSIQEALNQFLTNQQIITISIAYSTCNGRNLNTEELEQLHRYVQYMTHELLQYQTICLQYIEQQMIYTVPNMVSFLNSSALAAQILSHVPHGSIEQLAKIPACNLQLIGSSSSSSSSSGGGASKSQRGMTTTFVPTTTTATTTTATTATTTNTSSRVPPKTKALNNQPLPQHAGILIQCDLIQSVPKALQMKVLKIVASKLALVIRCDYNQYLYHQNTKTNQNTGSALDHNTNEGYMFRQQVQKKIQQLLEPEKAPTLKALPKPDLTVKKRRGGQRMRRLKGRYEETTLMKQANTRAFSVQMGEYGDDAMGRTLGLLEMSTGSVGASMTTEHSTIRSKNSIEQKKMKYANTRASRKKAAQMNRQGLAVASLGSSFDGKSSSGMASSMVFTPVQGMELINPDAIKDRVKEASRKWFSNNAGFQSAVPPKK